MSLVVALLFVVGGLGLLTLGAELLVRGAVTLARWAGLTPAVIGLTIVALGTSLPEVVVSVLAGLRGQGDLTVGNVLGSNIVNLTAILGTTALVAPLPVHAAATRLEWPVMMGATVLALVLLHDATVTRVEGGLLVVGLVAFVGLMLRVARREVDVVERAAEVDALAPPSRTRPAVGRSSAFVLAGAALLALGGHALVTGATTLALLMGLTERVVGLTVVAVGTSTPELAASIVAARRGHTELAVANVLGSNTINLLGVLGVSALVSPLTVAPGLAGTDGWWMLGTAALVLPVLRSGTRVSRGEGGLLVAVWMTYVAMLLMA
jgi:cation:H+ antiporter